MIRKTIVAAAFLLAFPALADDCGEKTDSDILEEAAAPYITCVMTTLDRLKEIGKPMAGERVPDHAQRWSGIVHEKCGELSIAPMMKIYAIYNDEREPGVYGQTVRMAMEYMTRNRAADTYWQSLMESDKKK
ncbi:MAG: hypothetical protein RBR34_09995 [Rhodospirillaceae bacterium]|nr:hypothetical protein [Rhodospirillaceae bacterium]